MSNLLRQQHLYHQVQLQQYQQEEDSLFAFAQFISSSSTSPPLMSPPFSAAAAAAAASASASASAGKAPPSSTSLHHLLGAGLVADVLLWRRKDVTAAALIALISAWFIFHVWAYTLLSLLSNVLLLFLSILFLWAKAAHLLNRPPPPVPDLQISEHAVHQAAFHLQSLLNKLLSTFRTIALGKDSHLFYASASLLWFLSLFGSLASFTTSFYISVLLLLTVPALYDKYSEFIDGCFGLAYTEVLMYERIYERVCFQCYCKVKGSIREIVKEDD